MVRRLVSTAFAALLIAAPLQGGEIGLELVAEGLTHPTAMESPPGDSRHFIAEQQGTIRILTADGGLLDEPFLDIRDHLIDIDEGFDERGLVGLAFHPDYAQNGKFYLGYAAPPRPEGHQGWDHTDHSARVSEFTVSKDDPNRADPSSERVLLDVDEPDNEHNLGSLAFDREGYLLIALGDGGLVDKDLSTTGQFSQRLNSLLGKIVRIDVDSRTDGKPYGIPPDNPFVAEPDARPEIFALGMCNSWRCTIEIRAAKASCSAATSVSPATRRSTSCAPATGRPDRQHRAVRLLLVGWRWCTWRSADWPCGG